MGIDYTSMASDLEAFSHYPALGSFAALAVQPTALPNERIKGSSRTNLNYYQAASSVG